MYGCRWCYCVSIGVVCRFVRCLAIFLWLSVAQFVLRRAKWMRAWRILTGVSSRLPHSRLVIFHLPKVPPRLSGAPSAVARPHCQGKKQGNAPQNLRLEPITPPPKLLNHSHAPHPRPCLPSTPLRNTPVDTRCVPHDPPVNGVSISTRFQPQVSRRVSYI